MVFWLSILSRYVEFSIVNHHYYQYSINGNLLSYPFYIWCALFPPFSCLVAEKIVGGKQCLHRWIKWDKIFFNRLLEFFYACLTTKMGHLFFKWKINCLVSIYSTVIYTNCFTALGMLISVNHDKRVLICQWLFRFWELVWWMLRGVAWLGLILRSRWLVVVKR